MPDPKRIVSRSAKQKPPLAEGTHQNYQRQRQQFRAMLRRKENLTKTHLNEDLQEQLSEKKEEPK